MTPKLRPVGAAHDEQTASAPKRGYEAMTNKDVLNMLAAGLGDDVIVLKINGADTMFDTAPDKLIELKKAGASDKLIAAVLSAKSTDR